MVKIKLVVIDDKVNHHMSFLCVILLINNFNSNSSSNLFPNIRSRLKINKCVLPSSQSSWFCSGNGNERTGD